MGRAFLERRYLETFLEMHPEFQPKPGYITREGLVSFARWLIEEGYCKLGREAEEPTIHVVLLYLRSKKLFERSGRGWGDQALYKINQEEKNPYEFVCLAAEIENLISEEAEYSETPRKWAWVPRDAVERKAKELGISLRKLVSIGVDAGLFKNWWVKKRIQAVKVWEIGKPWTKEKHRLEEYRSLKSILKEHGYSLKDPDVACALRALRKRSVSPNRTYIE